MSDTYRRDVLRVSEKHPELDQGQASDPGDGKETHPLDAESNAETEARHSKPEPPAQLKGLLRALFVLIRE